MAGNSRMRNLAMLLAIVAVIAACSPSPTQTWNVFDVGFLRVSY